MLSRISRNAIPSIKPAAAGIHAALPISADCSMDGISRLHTEAAVITPAAKPISALRTEIWNSFFIKKTHAAPRDVPRNGIRIPLIISAVILCSPFSCYQLAKANRILFVKPKMTSAYNKSISHYLKRVKNVFHLCAR